MSDRQGSIAVLQEWSEQKYGQSFSISACHDLLNVLENGGGMRPETRIAELEFELKAKSAELEIANGEIERMAEELLCMSEALQCYQETAASAIRAALASAEVEG